MFKGFLAFVVLFFGLRVFAEQTDPLMLTEIPTNSKITFSKDVYIAPNTNSIALPYESSTGVPRACSMVYAASPNVRMIKALQKATITRAYKYGYDFYVEAAMSPSAAIVFICPDVDSPKVKDLRAALSTLGIRLKFSGSVVFSL